MTAPILVAGPWRRNSDLIEDALALYVPPGSEVLDATWGKGNFWNTRTLNAYKLWTNDRFTLGRPPTPHYDYDYRDLPWTEMFDAAMFDPPYVVRGGRQTDSTFRSMNDAYGIHAAPTSVTALAEMNHAGLERVARTVRRGGIVFVKYADAVSSGKRHPQIHNITRFALEEVGLGYVDRLIFQTAAARPQPKRANGADCVQRHAHNNTSELLVFRKP